MATVFLDSDIIIASLLSTKGASFFLLQQPKIKFFISSFSVKELQIVTRRLNIRKQKLDRLIRQKLKIITLKETGQRIKEKYQQYVLDINDSHVIAGAVAAKTRFLLSYNLKHFKKEKIKQDFDLILFTPAEFLQYLRSQ